MLLSFSGLFTFLEAMSIKVGSLCGYIFKRSCVNHVSAGVSEPNAQGCSFAPITLEFQISVALRLLILRNFSRGYALNR